MRMNHSMKKMMKIFKAIIFFLHYLSFFTLLSCNNKSYFALEEEKKLREMRMQDHRTCLDMGLDFGVDEIETKIYYRCRLKLADYRIIDYKADNQTLRNNELIKKYQQNIFIELEKSLEELNDYRNNYFDKSDHKICEKRGNKVDSDDLAEVERYIECRYNLIREFEFQAPFNQQEYLSYLNGSYQIGYAIDKIRDRKIKKFNEEKKKYPNCVFLKINSKEYKNCQQDYDEQKKCYKNNIKKRINFEKEKRKICQNQLYKRYTENLLVEEKTELELYEKARAADSYNNNSFVSIGIDADILKTFQSAESYQKQQELERKKKEEEKRLEEEKRKNFNHEKQLYSKIELTRLKQKFIIACSKKTNQEVEKYYQSLQQECRSITLNWEEKKKQYE